MKTDSSQKFINMLGLCIKAGETCLGYQATITELKKRKLQLVILDSESSESTKKEFSDKCCCYGTELIIFEKDSLTDCFAKANKIYGIKNINFAKELKKLYNL